MAKLLRIGTRDSQLALWQADNVLERLKALGVDAELVLIKSEGDLDLTTPLYEMGVQGIFTRTLDLALLNNKIDVAVHSMKDVPTQLAAGLAAAAVLERGSYKDILVVKKDFDHPESPYTIATSSIRRKAQWLHRYPNHQLVNLRGNVNTRLRKVQEQDWQGAIFAAAGLERIGLRPANAIDLDWMLPAPAQGAILIVCRAEDREALEVTAGLNHEITALCTHIERSFLRTLLGGCSTPISALAEVEKDELFFSGNILTPDGKEVMLIEKVMPVDRAEHLGIEAATELIDRGAKKIIELIQHAAG